MVITAVDCEFEHAAKYSVVLHSNSLQVLIHSTACPARTASLSTTARSGFPAAAHSIAGDCQIGAVPASEHLLGLTSFDLPNSVLHNALIALLHARIPLDIPQLTLACNFGDGHGLLDASILGSLADHISSTVSRMVEREDDGGAIPGH